MSRPSRLRRWLKWAGLLLTCNVLAIGVVSIFANMGVTGRLLTTPVTGRATPFIHVLNAYAIVGRLEYVEKWWFHPIQGPRLPFFWRPRVIRRAYRRLGVKTPNPVIYSALLIPLWIPFVILALPTTYLFLRDRRRIPPGHCQTCGYNLTGNVSGVCPECGSPCKQPTAGVPPSPS